jgi:hypothetical protein
VSSACSSPCRSQPPPRLFYLEHAKAGLEKFYNFVARDPASDAACCDQDTNNQCPGIGIEEAGDQIFRRRRNVMLPILMFFMRTCRNEVGRAAPASSTPVWRLIGSRDR